MPGKKKSNIMANGTLYVVSTPVGNLGDITLRALEVLKGVGLVASEDTRHTRKLLSHYDIHKETTSFFAGNEAQKYRSLVEYLKGGSSIALVTDSGTPGVSDPGYTLVRAAVREGIRVEAIPGPSALLAALVASGAPMDEFTFMGFLPPKGEKRMKRIRGISDEERTVVLYESCHRVTRLFAELLEILGNRFIMVCRELTKKFEEVRRAPIREQLEHFEMHEPRGEFVIVIPKREKKRA